MDISAILLTYNEADRIGGAIDSVSWCDEVIIVDSMSTDGTRDIARQRGARVIDAPSVEPGEGFDHFRVRGINAAENDLVLTIDCDERIPEALRDELIERSQQPIEDIGVVRAPYLNFLGGKPLQGSGQWPGYKAILFDPSVVTFRDRVHGWMDIPDEVVTDIPARQELAVRHDFADSVWDHFQSQRRYAKIAGNNRPFTWKHLLGGPPWAFYDWFIDKKGYRDGITGVGLALCWSWFQFESRFRAGMQKLRAD